LLRGLESPDASIPFVVKSARAAGDAHMQYREALASIDEPLDDALAASLADQLDAANLLEAHDDLVAGLKANDLRLLRAADRKRSDGYVALSEAPLKVQDAMQAIVLKKEKG
jgi:hypothetical protein